MSKRSNERSKLSRDKSKPATARPSSGPPHVWVAALVLALAIGAVYGQSLDAPFIFDDVDGIVNNDSLHSLWPLIGPANHPGPLNPPPDLPSSGRPLVSLSLAANYSWGGADPFGYHVFNVTVHFLSAILLWAIVARTLRLPYFAGRFETTSGWLALATALLWALHPLQTEAVIYITQRSELMMAMFYLATLYCSMRFFLTLLPGEGRGEGALSQTNSLRTSRPLWLLLAVLASLCGMASKEVMVSAPLMVLLFERTFVAGSLGKALRRSWPLYVGLTCSWLLLLALNLSAPRGRSAGFQVGPPLISWWLTQSQVFWMYLKLVVWPSPLLIHYQLPYLSSLAEAWRYVLPLLVLLFITLFLLWRNKPAGYLAICGLAILAPTSIVPIPTEVAAERRMYLPLAAIVVLFVVGGYIIAQWLFRRAVSSRHVKRTVQLPLLLSFASVAILALTFGLVSAKHLRAYDDPVVLWREVVRFQPTNALAHGNLGSHLANVGRVTEGIAALEAAVELDPNDDTALANLGQALSDSGRLDEAIGKLRRAIALAPNSPLALNNLGVALIRAGRFGEAIGPLDHAVRVRPSFAMAHNNLGGALSATGKYPQAIDQFRQALELDPSLVSAHQNLAHALAGTGELTQAISCLEKALEIARKTNQSAAIQQTEQWIHQYQDELQRRGGAQPSAR